jgi:hypothetical protein
VPNMHITVGEQFDDRRLPRAGEPDDHYKLDGTSAAPLSTLDEPGDIFEAYPLANFRIASAADKLS